MSELIKSIEKTGKHQIKITLNEPNAPFRQPCDELYEYFIQERDTLVTKGEKEKIDHYP